MILPIFLTTQFLSVKFDQKGSPHKGVKTNHKVVALHPIDDPFLPVISTARIRELLKDLLNEDELTDVKPVILSIAPDNYDIEPEYDFTDILSKVPFPLIVPEYYYSSAIDFLSQSSINQFLNCRKYGIEIPSDIKIELDSIAISLYMKENIGKFISQNKIVISTNGINPDSKTEYIESMVKALSDNIQIAGVWKIFIDFDYAIFPNLIEALERDAEFNETDSKPNKNNSSIEAFFESFTNDAHGKLIIAPGVKEMQIGENDNFETLELTDQNLNKFKIGEDDKITFKWKSDKSKFDGEIYGSKTGIRLDVRARS